MSKRYRPWKIDDPMLLPATVQEFVDKDHLARFVLHLVVEEIDLEAIERVYAGFDRAGRECSPAYIDLAAYDRYYPTLIVLLNDLLYYCAAYRGDERLHGLLWRHVRRDPFRSIPAIAVHAPNGHRSYPALLA